MAGAYRGIAHGAKGVASQANLVPVNPVKAASLASGVANVMCVAAMVVGQYYMTEINGKLESLGKGIQSISNLLNQEIDGAILAKVAAVEAISAFSAEILSSPAERNRQLQALKIHKDDVSKLVGQANLAIKSVAETPDFKQGADGLKEYKSKIEELTKLTQRQQILMALFSQICDLEFALSLGEVSLEASRYELNKYDKSSDEVKAQLASWHERQIESLKIDFEKSRAIKGPIASLVGYLNEDWKYMRIDEEIQASITSQSTGSSTKAIAPADAFNNNVEIVIKNGEYWYRKPEANEN
jgi:hypothetical protein